MKESTRSEYLIGKLPHKTPMRMISEVLEAADRRAVCLIEVDASMCSLWGDGQEAQLYVGVELAAQAAAIAIGCDDEEGASQSGMLVQVRKLELSRQSVPLGTTLRCEVSVDVGLDGRFAVARGKLFLEDEELCSTQLSLAID